MDEVLLEAVAPEDELEDEILGGLVVSVPCACLSWATQPANKKATAKRRNFKYVRIVASPC